MGNGESLLFIQQVRHSGNGPMEGGAIAPESAQSSEIDELVFMKENVRLGLFQTQILEC